MYYYYEYPRLWNWNGLPFALLCQLRTIHFGRVPKQLPSLLGRGESVNYLLTAGLDGQVDGQVLTPDFVFALMISIVLFGMYYMY
jgi:hypothetical protein